MATELFSMQRFGEDQVADEDNERALLEKLQSKFVSPKAPEKGETTGDSKEEDGDNRARKKAKKKKRKTSKQGLDDGGEKSGFTILGKTSSKHGEISSKVRRVLPEWLANPDVVSVDLGDEQMSVSDMPGLDGELVNVLQGIGVKHFFPVQRQVIPRLFDSARNRFFRPPDLCVSAPTGSGKTLAFVLPIVQALQGRIVPRLKALVILPVQDLAAQVFKVFQKFCDAKRLKVRLVSGQKSFAQEQGELVVSAVDGRMHSLADIVVATPGRIVDHIRKTPGFDLGELRYLVVDEADRVMEDVQNDWLSHVEAAVYKGARQRPGPVNVSNALKMDTPLQKLLFSATLSQNPEKLQQLSLYEPKLFTSVVRPEEIVASAETENKTGDDDGFVGQYTTPAELTESAVRVADPLTKPLLLAGLIRQHSMNKVIVFANSIETCHKLAVLLKCMNLPAQELSSQLKFKRAKALSSFRKGKIDVLVATDALARGIDIGQVDFVVSYDCPKFVKTYVHRVGRTARAGQPGHAITLVDKRDAKRFKSMMAEAGKSELVKEINVDEAHMDRDLFDEAFEKAKEELSRDDGEKSKKTTRFKSKRK